MKKIMFFLAFLFFLFSCGSKNDVNGKEFKETPEVEELVIKWNDATSNKDIEELGLLLGNSIEYYQTTVTKEEYLKDKKNFFNKNSVYGQAIIGDIVYKKLSDKQMKVEFIKEVTTKKGTKEYPSYLVFENTKKGWKLILEGDSISDINIEKKGNSVSKVSNKLTYYYEEPSQIIGVINTQKIEGNSGLIYFLNLDKSINVLPKDSEDVINIEETGIKDIQLALDNEKIEFLKSKYTKGKKVKITGEFFHAHTSFHYTKIIMSVIKIEIL